MSTVDTKGHFDLAIKLYPKGAMSQHIESLKIGETLEIKGPKGKFIYKKDGNSDKSC